MKSLTILTRPLCTRPSLMLSRWSTGMDQLSNAYWANPRTSSFPSNVSKRLLSGRSKGLQTMTRISTQWQELNTWSISLQWTLLLQKSAWRRTGWNPCVWLTVDPELHIKCYVWQTTFRIFDLMTCGVVVQLVSFSYTSKNSYDSWITLYRCQIVYHQTIRWKGTWFTTSKDLGQCR